jgi:septal ring-binding cell division protein DamX
MILRLKLLLLFVLPCSLAAQAPNIKPYLVQIANGYTSEAKKALPDLLLDHPDDPAVMFLHASLVEEPKRALPLLERISSVYPKSEWCDDALLRIIYYSIGTKEVDRARKTFAQLRDQHGSSELLPLAYDAMRMTIGTPAPADKAPAAASTKVDAPVKTDASATKTDAATTAKTDATKTAKPFVIQVKSTPNKDVADALLAKLKKKRLRARMTSTTKGDKSTYVILVGEYATNEDAQRDVADVKAACKCSPTVVKQ